jgi:hypothetical protein
MKMCVLFKDFFLNDDTCSKFINNVIKQIIKENKYILFFKNQAEYLDTLLDIWPLSVLEAI